MERTVVASVASLAALAGHAGGQVRGPTSSATPYVVPAHDRVATVSLLTAGDEVAHPDGGTYRLAGIPDGTDAFAIGDGTFVWLVNHELGADEGIVRDHGAPGAFVSRWIVDPESHEIVSGQDHIEQSWVWDADAGAWASEPTAFDRLCSANLARQAAFFNAASGLGTLTRIYLSGEESGPEGRVFAHLADGQFAGNSYEVARLGNFSWENCLAAPGFGDTTVVAGLDDDTPGEVYVYIGAKTDQAGVLDSAGLTNGSLYGVRVEGLAEEDAETGLGGPDSLPFELFEFGDVSSWDGAALQSASDDADVTAFLRPEDGHWDPTQPGRLYWVTTGAGGAPARLWLLAFEDILQPEVGGTIHLLLDGTEGVVNADNIVVDHDGNVLIQEDPGDDPLLARLWHYDPDADELTLLARHDPARFSAGGGSFLTENEESSGIIDAIQVMGEGWYLLDSQAHFDIGDDELVEGGQLLGLWFRDAVDCFVDFNGDDELNVLDFVAYQEAWQAQAVEADVNFDQQYDILDFVAFNELFVAGCG